MSRTFEGVKIIGATTLLAVAFGVLHDIFSAAVHVEYFTEHHPRLIESPHWLAMALLWGFVATWWVGLFGGIWLAICTQVGRARPVPFGRVMRAACKAAVAVLVLAPVTWAVIYFVGTNVLHTKDPTSTVTDLSIRLLASATMHAQSYALAALFFIVMGIAFCFKRYRGITAGRRP